MRGFRRRRRLWRDKTGGEEKNLIKRRVERQKVFSSPPAKKSVIFYNTTTDFLKSPYLFFAPAIAFSIRAVKLSALRAAPPIRPPSMSA